MWNLLRGIYRMFRVEPISRFWRNRNRIVEGRSLLTPWYEFENARILRKFNAEIPCTGKINPFVTPHGLSGIFISNGAVMGRDCTIFHQVTIGSNTLPDSRGQGAPVIGDNVYIGVGAKIIGGITVGNNVRIGANCVVTFDVPDNATVVAAAPKVIPHDTPRDNTFLHWPAYAKRMAQAQAEPQTGSAAPR